MSVPKSADNDEYNRISKALAAFLSPWALLVLSICVLGITYLLYYKPRLFYGYKSYPSGTSIYLTPPIWRKRKFEKHPVQFLKSAQKTSMTIFWTDVVTLPAFKTLSVICDARMASQFLDIDDQDSLSWDAPMRAAWNDIIDHNSNFGVCRQFYAASRYALVNVFTEESTRVTSSYARVIQNTATSAFLRNESLDLYGLLDQITSASLLSIFLGRNNASEELVELFDRIASSLTDGEYNSNRSIKSASSLLRGALTRMVSDRLVDAERSVEHSDYMQWLILNEHVFTKRTEPATSTDRASQSTRTKRTTAWLPDTWISDIADHLIVTILQTRLLVTSCTFWALMTKVVQNTDFCCAPLLLIRQTREETLFGSKIVPKNCLVAISPPVLQAAGHKLANLAPQTWNMQRHCDISEADEHSTVCSMADSPQTGYKSPMLRQLGSMEGRSPLLMSTRYSSSISMNNLSEPYSCRQWDRWLPQGHLIQLMKNMIIQATEERIVLPENTTITQVYGSARALWLPIPQASISITQTSGESSSS